MNETKIQPIRYVFAITVVVVAAILAVGIYVKAKKPLAQSHRTYSLNLMDTTAFNPNEPANLKFDIIDENKAVLKDFDTVHEKLLHLIVVRKDRTNFQHVHPEIDSATGTFRLSGFKFPTDGQYRIFADFTPLDAQKDPTGTKLAVTPYQDVKVGSGAFTPQVLASDKLSSSANGLNTNVFFPPSDDSPGGGLLNKLYAGADSSVNIKFTKNGAPFTNLESYLGALGHMVVLGPNLEFIHAHPLSSDINNQSGLVTFMVNFPTPGRYTVYLQTQAAGQVDTTDYALSVLPNPASSSKTDSSTRSMDMNK